MSAGNFQGDETFARLNPGAQFRPYVMFEVMDTGTGISPEILDRIFDPFFTTKEAGKGTGLGLSTVNSIIKGHQGVLQGASESGQGSKFQSLHSRQPERRSGPAQPGLEDFPKGNGEWILVVDDELPIQQATELILERYGYQVLVASHGTDALRFYQDLNRKIDLA